VTAADVVDGPGECVVVDCTAGADSFASGLFTRFDLTVLVAEPTRKGISVYRQRQGYAAGHHVALVVAGNKVQTEQDVAGTVLQPVRPERRHVGRARPAPGHARRPAQGLVPKSCRGRDLSR
jgi:hypothetical protein